MPWRARCQADCYDHPRRGQLRRGNQRRHLALCLTGLRATTQFTRVIRVFNRAQSDNEHGLVLTLALSNAAMYWYFKPARRTAEVTPI